MQSLRLFLLGPPRVECEGRSIKPGTRKTLALLAYLAVTRTNSRRESIINLLWPDYPRGSGQASLRNSLWRLCVGQPAQRGLTSMS